MNDDYGTNSYRWRDRFESCYHCGNDMRYCGCEARKRKEYAEAERQRREIEAIREQQARNELARLEKERAREEERAEMKRIEAERERIKAAAAKRTFIDEELNELRDYRSPNGQYRCKWCGHKGSVLVRRTGKYGVFYGCSNYPRCKFSYSPPGVEKPWSNGNKKTATNANNDKDGENKMNRNGESKTAQVIDTLKGEGKDAAWQVAANQTVKAATKTLTSVMKRRKMARTKIAQLTGLLETDIGKTLFSFGLGAAISASPLGETPKMKRLARELRVKGMREGGDMIADIASDPAIELIQSIISDLPAVE